MIEAAGTRALAFEPAVRLLERIRRRQIGCRELLEHYIARTERYGATVNAIVVRNFDAARECANAADRALARGESLGALHGLPMTVKESFNLRGTPTTFGLREFRDNLAHEDAVVVARLVRAGAVIFGKTNVPPGLMDGQSANELYGRTNNPWNPARTPGGSSGGSAAALAAGLTGLELGSDIASSIRNPAHYCGVFGHKPTFGICPQRGHMLTDTLQATDLAVVGPLGRSAADLELALSVIAGPCGAEARAWSLELPPPTAVGLADFRVAVVLDDAFAEVDRSVERELAKLADFLVQAGARVEHATRPSFDSGELYRLYMVLLRAAGSAGIADEEFAREQALAHGAHRATREMARLNAYGATLTHRDWLRLDEERLRNRAKWIEFFERVDLLLCPTLSTAAFPHSTVSPAERTLVVNGREVPFENQLLWAGLASLSYLPASVAPIGLTAEGLPVGVQVIGAPYADLTCLRFARLLEERYRAFVPPPGFSA
ncbi:MAG TPA: amidase [Steroidobacteraceae bacterium]|nr:amidase [Steroidobacteraceae bacterium]